MSGLGRFSIGIGDRFGHEGRAQLRALQAAADRGLAVTPAWNKSHREHTLIGTTPDDARRRADEAVRSSGWSGAYYVDADHIRLATVDGFLAASDFFTIDVADEIGRPSPDASRTAFAAAMSRFHGALEAPGLPGPLRITPETVEGVSRKYLAAAEEAGRVYRRILEAKGRTPFVTEVSLDETDAPQTPAELFLILGALAGERVPVQTIAPKFSGAFLKGVDYRGDIRAFGVEFAADLAAVELARTAFGLPDGLKLSVHSGSDKFSLYPVMHRALVASGAGLHLKTAGTTWLEEVAGLAAAGGEGLALAKEIYAAAVSRSDELARPYRSVIEIERDRLPSPAEVRNWAPRDFVETLRHDPANPRFNPDFRQLVHISFRVAAEMGRRFTDLLDALRPTIAPFVTENLWARHIAPLFLGAPPSGAAARSGEDR